MHHIWIVHCENDLKTVLILIASRYLCMLRFILIDMSHPSSLFKTFSKERNIYNLLIKCKQNWLKFILQQLSKKHGLDYWKSKKVYMYKLHSITVYIYIYLQKKYCSILLFNILHSKCRSYVVIPKIVQEFQSEHLFKQKSISNLLNLHSKKKFLPLFFLSISTLCVQCCWMPNVWNFHSMDNFRVSSILTDLLS